MSVVTITRGDHERIAVTNDGSCQFAHAYMPTDAGGTDPEGHEHQAWNFMIYAAALGPSVAPHVLLAPPLPDDEAQAERLGVEMDDWKDLVETSTGVKVEIS